MGYSIIWILDEVMVMLTRERIKVSGVVVG